LGRLLALTAALIAAVFIAWAGEQTPRPAPSTSPAAGFSADRAFIDIVAFASKPHPIGSPADRQARDYLMARMKGLGLEPQIFTGVGVDQPKGAPNVLLAGSVEDILGVLPGKDRNAPALALMAHYDSVPGSPGGSDDAAGVASGLEIVRAIKARGVPARDVVLLLTDGEEAGLLGADAFFGRDALAKRIGFVLNMDVRGAAGRVQMFQTGEQNGEAIRLMARVTPRPVASSLASFVYKYIPNDTDFTIARRAGLPGLNYAFIDHQFDYHSPSSTPAAQDRGTLQDMGDQVLAAAEALAFAPALPARAPDLVFGQTPGAITLAYPANVGWVVLIAAMILFLWGVLRAQRIKAFSWVDIARGAGGGLFAVVGGVAILHFARRATGVSFGYIAQRFLLAQAHLWETALMILGLGAILMAAAELARGRRRIAMLPLAAGLGCWLLGGLDKIGLGLGLAGALVGLIAYGRPVSRPGAWCGVLLLGLVVATAAQTFAPLAAFIFAWPLALACLGAAVTALGAQRGAGSLGALALVAAIGGAFAATLAHAAFLGLDLPELLGLPLLIAVLVIWPLAQTDEGAPPARLLGPILILTGLAVTAAVRFNHPYDARHPQASFVGYQVDQDQRRAWRYSDSPEHSDWADRFLKAGGASIGKLKIGLRGRSADATPAPYVDFPKPQFAFATGPSGQVRLRLTPPPGVRVVQLRLTADTAATLLGVGGVSVHLPMKPGGETLINWAAASQGFELTFQTGGPGKLSVDYDAILEQWPEAIAPPPKRPANLMAFDTSDSTSLMGRRDFTW